MPRAPPRPLRLPDLVTNPQARAEYVQSHPPIYGYVSSPRDLSPYPDTPSSPSSTSASLHRISGTTMASLGSPLTPASTHTSSSVHNATWINELGKRVSASAFGLMPNPEEARVLPESDTGSKKPRASWSSAIASTKSWFRSSTSPETQDTSTLTIETRLKEIRLSPSMVAANAAKYSAQRHLSSPYPESPLSTCTTSTFTSTRAPRVGSGLRYYTEHNPAPPQTRVGSSLDPAAPPDISSPRLSLSHDPPGGVTLTLTTSAAEGLPTQKSSHLTSESRPDAGMNSDSTMLPREPCGTPPPSPPPTPPKNNKRASDTPDINIIPGDQL